MSAFDLEGIKRGQEEDSVLAAIRGRMQERETALVQCLLQLDFNDAVVELGQTKAWLKLVSRLQTVEAGEVGRLISQTPTLYDLGVRQGTLKALRMVVSPEPLKKDAVDKLRAEAQTLREMIEVDRKVLEQ